MKQDFLFSVYDELLEAIQSDGYKPTTYLDFLTNPPKNEKVFVLRHDVDRLPANALTMAKLQYKRGIKATYYWRIVSESYDENIIREVVDLGHELGFHYEDLTLAKGDKKKAIELFEKNLEQFRKFYPVKTICMHGSPFTKWDNREVWKEYDYRQFGIEGEPYFDTNFGEVFYVTDTGRKWNEEAISVRDRVDSGFSIPITSTFDLIDKINGGALPQLAMHNVHPHRWSGTQVAWLKEIVGQNLKNEIKRVLIRLRKP